MNPLIAGLVPLLIWAMGKLVFRVLLALGIGFVTYTGLTALMNAGLSYITTLYSGLPSIMIGALQVMNVPQCFTILSSAVVARVTISGLRRFATNRAPLPYGGL